MQSDADLLAQFANRQSQAAFAELVRRHLALVYSAALRRCDDASQAEEATQDVFVVLARKAPGLVSHPSLTGWLHVTACHVAAKTRRAALRRTQTALRTESMQIPSSPDSAGQLDWEHARSVIDDALLELRESDRTAVLLRFFANRSFEEIGAALGLKENTARMRVDRALEKLQAALSRRGVTSTAAALGLALSAHAVAVPPAGLAVTVALTAGAAAPAAGWILFMQSTTLKVGVAAVALATTSAGWFWQRHENAVLRDEIAQVRARLDRGAKSATGTDAGPSTSGSEELARLRAELANNPAFQWTERANLLREMVAQVPRLNIPELKLATDEDWLDAAKDKLESEEDYRRALAQIRNLVVQRYSSQIGAALRAFLKKSGELFPATPAELEPFMEHSLGAAAWQRYEVQPASLFPNIKMGDEKIITLRGPLDEDYDQATVIGSHGIGTTTYRYLAICRVTDEVVQAYRAAHPGSAAPTNPADLLAYARTEEQKKVLSRLVEESAK